LESIACPKEELTNKKNETMTCLTANETDCLLSQEAIEKELEQIFLDSRFAESRILKDFLAFIVKETLHGRANCLKEYTIAVNVLSKPLNFKPQENGIVRIHAGRLRRALSQYYNEQGANDPVIIRIPKGQYVPHFSDRLDSDYDTITIDDAVTKSSRHDGLTVAILPFLSATHDSFNSFADGLCMQMTSMLLKLNKITVIPYGIVKNHVGLCHDYRDLNESLHSDFMISGCIQHTRDKMRVIIQLIDCSTYTHVWSETYEKRITKSNIFDIQDVICQDAVSRLEGAKERLNPSANIVSLRSAI
jgi:TolB-like protein